MTYVVGASEPTVVTLVVTALVPDRLLISICEDDCSRLILGKILDIQIPLAVAAGVNGQRRDFVVETIADFGGVGRLEVEVRHTRSRLGSEYKAVSAKTLI